MAPALPLLALLCAWQTHDPIAELTRKSVVALQEMARADKDHSEGRYDAAVIIYEKYLEDPDFDPGRFIPGSGRHSFAAHLRVAAQSRLPLSLEAAGRYKEALIEYWTPVKFYGSGRCGNAIMDLWAERRAGAVRCLKALSRKK